MITETDRLPAPLAAGDREILGFHGVIVPRNYPEAIAALAGTGFVPAGRDLPPQPFRLPFDWNADPLKDGNWMFQLHAWRMLDAHFTRLLADPGHPRAFADILEVIADWHRGNVETPPGPFSWYDMSTGLRALKLALLGQVAARRGHVLADSELIADLVARHMAELGRPEGLGWNNHGLFQLSGLKALLWQYPDLPGAEAARTFATERMAALIDSQLGPEGVHTEHSPDYHFFTLTVIGRHLKAPWWQLDAMAACREKLAVAGHARYWLVDPAGCCLPVGDSAPTPKITDFTGIDRWPHQRRGEAMGAVLDGYAMVRTDPAVPVSGSAMLFLTASFNSHTHKQADCLSLIWQEGGEDLLIDSGKYGYGGGAMRAYFVSTCAHNAIEVDGRSFSRKDEDAYGSGVEKLAPLDRTWHLEAEAPHRQVSILHRRSIFFRPHDFLLVVDHMAVARPRRRTFTAWWHFNPDHTVAAAPDEEGRHLVSGLAGGRRLFVSHVGSGADPRVEFHRGTREPRLQGWISRGYLQSAPAPVLGFSGGSGGSFVAATLFELAGPGEAVPRLGLHRAATGEIVVTDRSETLRAGAPEGARFTVGEAVLGLPGSLL